MMADWRWMMVSAGVVWGCAIGCATAESKAQSAALLAALNSYDDAGDVEKIRARVSQLRARQNRGLAAPFMVVRSNLASVKQSIAEGWEPEVALEYNLQGSADDSERTIRYWCLRIDKLEELKVPADLMRPIRLNLAIAIFRFPPERRPRYLVLLATPSIHEWQVH
jgi:hypothetical protein